VKVNRPKYSFAHSKVVVITVPWPQLEKKNQVVFERLTAPLIRPRACLVVDLGRVETIDDAGVRILMGLFQKALELCAQVKFCNLSQKVRDFLEYVRVHYICELYNTREEAMYAFQLQ
jgi:anti-anti-sigma regulatory factor